MEKQGNIKVEESSKRGLATSASRSTNDTADGASLRSVSDSISLNSGQPLVKFPPSVYEPSPGARPKDPRVSPKLPDRREQMTTPTSPARNNNSLPSRPISEFDELECKQPIFKDDADEKYFCVVTKEGKHILHQSIQSFCGHRLCLRCKQKLFEDDESPKCPGCQKEQDEENEYSILKEETVFPDRAIDREIGMLKVSCPHQGCTWNGKFKEFQKHLPLCEFKEEVCPFGCGQTYSKSEEDSHNKGNVHKHLDLLLTLITTLSSRVLSLGGGCHEKDNLEKKISSLENNVSSFQNRIEEEKKSGNFQKHGGQVNSEELSKVKKNCDTTLNVVAVLNTELEKLIRETTGVQKKQKTDSETVNNMQQKVRALERDLARKDIAIQEKELRIKALEMTSFDGVLVWPINKFSELKTEALNGGSQSIYSPPFYTSRSGYKLCARIYLNGDGMGKGSHISLFLVVMRGPYDAILKWPFRNKVSLILLDQSNKEHIVDAFRPDPTSSSFKRPVTDMNIASGCPMFAPLAKVEDRSKNYLKDDTIFVKIIVETE